MRRSQGGRRAAAFRNGRRSAAGAADCVHVDGDYHEIIGLDVYENDQLIGQIKEILQPGANDVWVVKRKGKRDLLLPYIPPVVLNIDIPGNRVDVDILEGLDDED